MEFDHYFIDKEKLEELKIIEEIIRGYRFKFYTAKGVFSKDKVDEGTKLLAETMVLFENQKVLDLGCGYGVLGIVTKKVCKDCEVYLSDNVEIAVKLSEINAKINNVKVNIIKSNLFENINEKFDNIITNPPFTMGKEMIKKWVKESYEHLNKNGILQLVATKKFRYVEKIMEKYFRKVLLLNKSKDYLIFVGIK